MSEKYDPLYNPNPKWMKEAKSAGKGDRMRPVNMDKYRDNYDAIFAKKNEEKKDEGKEDDSKKKKHVVKRQKGKKK
tara:strand:+ start:653 stop:880 length:228 start_codon:yes stop_codon:yes gene_type:complete